MSMNSDEKGAYIRCCNFLIEMLLKYGTDGNEDNPQSQTKEGGDFSSSPFLYFQYLFLFTFRYINDIL